MGFGVCGAIIEEGNILPLLKRLDNSQRDSSSTSGDIFSIAMVIPKSLAKRANFCKVSISIFFNLSIFLGEGNFIKLFCFLFSFTISLYRSLMNEELVKTRLISGS